jgi:hypothetical protein
LVRRQKIKTGLHHPLIKTNLAIERKKAILIKNNSAVQDSRILKSNDGLS